MFYSHYDLVQQIADFLKFHDFEEIEVKVRLTNGEEIKFELTRAEDDWEEEDQLEEEIIQLLEEETDWDEEKTDWDQAKDSTDSEEED